MEIKQIASIINEVTAEVLGESVLVQEDLSNIVDVGTAVFNASSFDKYCKSLIDHVGKVVFVNRKYRGRVPSILMDGWEYGAVLEKIATDVPDCEDNESWELEDGTSYDPNVFNAPSVSAHFYNKRVTFQCKLSTVSEQFKSAFSDATQGASFIAMLFNSIETSMTVKLDALIMRTIANMIAETVYDDFGANAITGGSHVKAVNLLYLYNDMVGEGNTITAGEMCTNPEFIRFAINIMNMYKDRLASLSTLFNIDGKARFTPEDRLHFVVLSEFDAGAKAYLQSDSYHADLVSLPKHEVVPYWQGSGTGFAFADTSKVYVTDADSHNVTVTGVLAVMFDSDACAVTNMNRRTTAQYNARGEFTNTWFKMDAGYLNSFQENFVVFFGASA